MSDKGKHYTLNEEQALQILNTEPAVIKESNVKNDLFMTREERIENARKILKDWKENN